MTLLELMATAQLRPVLKLLGTLSGERLAALLERALSWSDGRTFVRYASSTALAKASSLDLVTVELPQGFRRIRMTHLGYDAVLTAAQTPAWGTAGATFSVQKSAGAKDPFIGDLPFQLGTLFEPTELEVPLRINTDLVVEVLNAAAAADTIDVAAVVIGRFER